MLGTWVWFSINLAKINSTNHINSQNTYTHLEINLYSMSYIITWKKVFLLNHLINNSSIEDYEFMTNNMMYNIMLPKLGAVVIISV